MDSVQSRLRRWREEVKRLSVREFHQRVNAHLPPGRRVSLGSVSNYERSGNGRGAGAPPRADYLAAVKRAFPELRLEWLLLGEGEPTVAGGRVAESAGAARGMAAAGGLGGLLADRLPDLGLLSPEASALFLGALTRYATGDPGMDVGEREILELAEDLRWLLLLPLSLWGFRHEPDYERFSAYSVAMLHALMQAMPGPGRGDPIASYPGFPARELREAAPVGFRSASR